MSDLFDIKSDLFKRAFSDAVPYLEFVKRGSPNEQQKWEAGYSAVSLNQTEIAVTQTFVRKLHLLVLAGLWCGDCSRQCPMLVRIAESTPVIDLRFLDNNAIPEVRDELRIHGASRVPVLVALSEDFFEVTRFGDRPLSVYERKVAKEAGVSCAISFGAEPLDELHQDIDGWLEVITRAQLILRTSGLLRKRYND